MIDQKCVRCVNAVCKDARLLEGGDWRVGADASYHWTLDIDPTSVCGVLVIRDQEAK